MAFHIQIIFIRTGRCFYGGAGTHQFFSTPLPQFKIKNIFLQSPRLICSLMCSFRLPQPGQKLQGRLSFPGLGLWHLAGLELVLILYLPRHKPRGVISSKGKKGMGLEATLDWRVGLGRWGQLCHLQGLGTLVTDEVECGALCSEGDHDLMENPRTCSAGFLWEFFPEGVGRTWFPPNWRVLLVF